MLTSKQLVGKKIGSYKILGYLGKGAMAQVHKAQHVQLNRYAAIKILHPHFVTDPEFVKQFKEEARSLAQLRHPNIVQVYDADITGDYPYLAMEYIDGRTLKFIIKEYREKHTRLPLVRILRIVYSIGLALAYAHQREVIHRDVKPSNVLVEDSGRVVLADFGLARFTDQPGETKTGTVKGTPAYMSPEQALGQSGHPRSDIYSLGVIFYELLTGTIPFSDENPIAIAMKHITEPLKPPRLIVPEIPKEVESIVVQAMSKNPNERYGTVNDFLHDLTKVRLKIRTTRLPTASLSSLKDTGDDTASWKPPDRFEGQQGNQVCIHILETGQIINLENGKEYTIGRKHKSQPIVPDIDLTPFEGYDWGISRLHATISLQPEEVTLTDIGSSNGTWHGGKRLEKNQPCQLAHGETFYLGKLKIQLLNYEA